VGKTSVLTRTINLLKENNFTIGGVLSREIKDKGERIGFELIDLGTERSGILAASTIKTGPRLRKYRINLIALADIGASALDRAKKLSDIIICDEVGPMELHSPEFRRAVTNCAKAGKPSIFVVPAWFRDPLIEYLNSIPHAVKITVTLQNRSRIPNELASCILDGTRGVA